MTDRPLVGLTILGQPIEYMKIQAFYRRIVDDPPYLIFQLQNHIMALCIMSKRPPRPLRLYPDLRRGLA